MSKNAVIGDPLDAFERAQKGQVGGGRRASAVPETPQYQEREDVVTKPPRIARTYYLTLETAREIKKYAAAGDLGTSDVVQEALDEYFARRKR